MGGQPDAHPAIKQRRLTRPGPAPASVCINVERAPPPPPPPPPPLFFFFFLGHFFFSPLFFVSPFSLLCRCCFNTAGRITNLLECRLDSRARYVLKQLCVACIVGGGGGGGVACCAVLPLRRSEACCGYQFRRSAGFALHFGTPTCD